MAGEAGGRPIEIAQGFGALPFFTILTRNENAPQGFQSEHSIPPGGVFPTLFVPWRYGVSSCLVWSGGRGEGGKRRRRGEEALGHSMLGRIFAEEGVCLLELFFWCVIV